METIASAAHLLKPIVRLRNDFVEHRRQIKSLKRNFRRLAAGDIKERLPHQKIFVGNVKLFGRFGNVVCKLVEPFKPRRHIRLSFDRRTFSRTRVVQKFFQRGNVGLNFAFDLRGNLVAIFLSRRHRRLLSRRPIALPIEIVLREFESRVERFEFVGCRRNFRVQQLFVRQIFCVDHAFHRRNFSAQFVRRVRNFFVRRLSRLQFRDRF